MLGKVYQKPSGRYRLKSLAMFSIVRSEIIPEIIKESYNFRVANGLHIEAVAKARHETGWRHSRGARWGIWPAAIRRERWLD